MKKDIICKNCGSDRLIKYGRAKNKYNKKQRYYCKACETYITNRKSIKGFRTPAKVMSEGIDDHEDGKSFWKISYRIGKSPSTIFNWATNVPQKLVKEVANRISNACFSNVRHADISDIMMTKIKVFNKKKGKYEMKSRKANLWASKDNTSKFIVTHHLSMKKDKNAAYEFFNKMLESPRFKYIITDGAFSFNEPIEQVLNSNKKYGDKQKVKHIIITKAKRKKDRGVNNLIERTFDDVKSRTKVTRRYKKLDSMKKTFYTMMLNANFLKPHLSLKKSTPADIAGIGIKHGRTIGFYDLLLDFGLFHI